MTSLMASLPRPVRRGGNLIVRIVALVVIVGAVGALLGWVVSYPLRIFKPDVSQAIRLDQARLAGSVLPESALITAEDLNAPWAPTPPLAQPEPIGSDVCGEALAPGQRLGKPLRADFKDTSVDAAGVVSQVQRFDRFNDAAAYVSQVANQAAECGNGSGTYFVDAFGTKFKMTVTESPEDLLITDQVRLVITSEDQANGAKSSSVLSLMAVGDVVTGYTYQGPPAREGFLPGVERKVLARLVPDRFGTGGVDGEENLPDATVTVPVDGQPAEGQPVDGQPAEGQPETPAPAAADPAN